MPEWARETIAHIAREHPQNLGHLDQVAQIEAAKRHAVEHPPPPPTEPIDLLHLSAIHAWQTLASGQREPDLDPDLDQDGDLRPDVLDAISAAIWFGLTAGYLTLTGSDHIPASSWRTKGRRHFDRPVNPRRRQSGPGRHCRDTRDNR